MSASEPRVDDDYRAREIAQIVAGILGRHGYENLSVEALGDIVRELREYLAGPAAAEQTGTVGGFRA